MIAPAISRAEILSGVAAVATEHLGLVGELDPRARLVEDLGFDSLKLLTLAAEVENRFRVALDAEDDAAIATVGDLVDRLERKLGVRPDDARNPREGP
jgi:acyl carrier protein